MRYIGNKTRLLGFIRRVLERRGIEPGLALDPFTGTASVARALKRRGHRVVAGDLMEYGHVFAQAYVAADGPPEVAGLGDLLPSRRRDLRGAIAYLNRVPGRPGFVHEHYSPEGRAAIKHGDGRMYFTPANAARIDAIRSLLESWREQGRIGDLAYYVLLTALIEAADRVANTAGVYAAFIKSWQPNALRPLRLATPRLVPGNGCRAVRADALELVAAAGPVDLLYLDPPYNGRQYPGYYHIPELLALGWFGDPVRLRGKTGLLPDEHKRSDWSRRSRCEEALEALVAAARCRHLVMSYNSEGIIPAETIEAVLVRHGRAGTFRRYTHRYRRYRSDADGDGRRYAGDSVEEYLYCVEF